MSDTKITPIAGYRHIALQEGVCGGRPTIIGHRIEPRHLSGYKLEDAVADWDYIPQEAIEEAFRFHAANPHITEATEFTS